jgi:hypothetical protein
MVGGTERRTPPPMAAAAKPAKGSRIRVMCRAKRPMSLKYRALSLPLELVIPLVQQPVIYASRRSTPSNSSSGVRNAADGRGPSRAVRGPGRPCPDGRDATPCISMLPLTPLVLLACTMARTSCVYHRADRSETRTLSRWSMLCVCRRAPNCHGHWVVSRSSRLDGRSRR